jgi:hypothetical protein
MKIHELKKIVDEACEYAPNGEIEIFFKKKTYELGRISQSGILGRLFIEVGAVVFDENSAFPNSANNVQC